MHQRRRSGLPDVIAAPARRMKVPCRKAHRGLSVLRGCAGPAGPGDGKRGRLTGTCRGDPPASPATTTTIRSDIPLIRGRFLLVITCDTGPAASDSAAVAGGLRLRRPGLDLGRGLSEVPAVGVVCGGAGEGVPRDGQSVSNVTGIGRHRDRHPHGVGTSAVLGGDLGRSDGRVVRISQSTLEAGTDGSPGTPSAAARHGHLYPVARRPPGCRPPRHVLMIAYDRRAARPLERQFPQDVQLSVSGCRRCGWPGHCAGECRLVRVTGVLIFVNGRACVAFVLLATGPFKQRAYAASGPGGPASGPQDELPRLPTGQRTAQFLLAPGRE
jgi:hypothetical protein